MHNHNATKVGIVCTGLVTFIFPFLMIASRDTTFNVAYLLFILANCCIIAAGFMLVKYRPSILLGAASWALILAAMLTYGFHENHNVPVNNVVNLLTFLLVAGWSIAGVVLIPWNSIACALAVRREGS